MNIGCDIERTPDGLTILAPAKVNLFLSVGDRRSDGYHLIDTVMVTVGLCDRIWVEPADALGLRLKGDAVDLEPEPDNLCLVAANKLATYANIAEAGAHITVDKRIPVGAGLGGGSTDAAATLLLLNELWDLNLSLQELVVLGSSIGADVPFCISGGVARGTGLGADITRLASSLPRWFVIAYPRLAISTSEAYRWLDEQRSSPCVAAADHMIEHLVRGNVNGVEDHLHNDFQPIIVSKYKEVSAVLDVLREHNIPSVMSGSGSSVFGLTDDPVGAGIAATAAENTGADVWVVPCARARLKQELQLQGANRADDHSC